MKRIVFALTFLLTISAGNCLFGINKCESVNLGSIRYEQDTLKENQSLYTGKVWKKMYQRINGDQFLFSNYFLPGTVSTNSKTFRNLVIRYDIYSDQLMIPVNREEIIQLNKEMIDSFSITFEDKIYRFLKVNEDSLNAIKGFQGYLCVLFKQASALYIKYTKDISPDITEKSDGKFIQTQKIYFVKDHIVYMINSTKDLYKALHADETQIRNYLKSNKLKVSQQRPESLVPVIRYYDSI